MRTTWGHLEESGHLAVLRSRSHKWPEAEGQRQALVPLHSRPGDLRNQGSVLGYRDQQDLALQGKVWNESTLGVEIRRLEPETGQNTLTSCHLLRVLVHKKRIAPPELLSPLRVSALHPQIRALALRTCNRGTSMIQEYRVLGCQPWAHTSGVLGPVKEPRGLIWDTMFRAPPSEYATGPSEIKSHASVTPYGRIAASKACLPCLRQV